MQFQAVLASKMAPTWAPKTRPKSTQNLTNRLQISTSLQDAPKTAPKLEKHPKICKISKDATNMAASWASNSNKIHAKSVSRDRFPGNSKNFQTCATIDYHNTTLVVKAARSSLPSATKRAPVLTTAQPRTCKQLWDVT